jgi:hypothetical protein
VVDVIINAGLDENVHVLWCRLVLMTFFMDYNNMICEE